MKLTDDEVEQLSDVAYWSRWRILNYSFGAGIGWAFYLAVYLIWQSKLVVRPYFTNESFVMYAFWGFYTVWILFGVIIAIPTHWVLIKWMASVYRKTWALLVNTDFPHFLIAKKDRQELAKAVFPPFKPEHQGLGKYNEDLNIWLVLVASKQDALVKLKAASKNQRTLRGFRRKLWWANLFGLPNHCKQYTRRLAYCHYLLNEPNTRWLKGWHYPWPRREKAPQS